MSRAFQYRAEFAAIALAAALTGVPPAHAQSATNLGSVEAQASTGPQSSPKVNFASQVLTAKQKQKATQPVKSVSRSTIDLFGPDAGGVQALSVLPNVQISGYNAGSASGRSTISMRGVKVGYNSIPGDLETNGITAEFDGVPLNSLSQGTGWHSPETPIGALMSGINVVEGAGNPRDRWYNSLGGTINFIPVQPTERAGGEGSLSGGSFSSAIASAVYDTGTINGWSTVVGAAGAHSESIRNTSDYLPSDSEQGYIKTRKTLASGSISFGAYYERNDEWRPNMIPVGASAQIFTGGLGGPGVPYSEQTSGFYSTLPKSVWNKHNEILNYLVWSHARLELAPHLELSNVGWFRIGKIRHYRTNDYSLPTSIIYTGNTTNVEHYIETSKTFGDRVSFDAKLADIDTLSFGAYIVDSRAQSEYNGYSTFDGSSLAQPESVGFNTTNSIDWAGFVQDEFHPVRGLEIVPGFRMVGFITDWSNMSPTQTCNVYHASGCAYGSTIPVFPVAWSVSYDTNPDQTTDFVRTEPSIGANYALGGGFNLFASYAIATHNPSSGVLDTYPLELAALKPVRSATYDFGLRYVGHQVAGMRRLYGSVEFFHTLLDNQTIPHALAINPLVTTFGYGSATLKGVDFSLEADVDSRWSGFANFGWLDSRWNSFYSASANAYFNGLPVSNSPEDDANVGVSYHFLLPSATVKATLWDQYTGHRYLWNNNVGAPTNLAMPSYDLLNFSLTARTTFLSSLIPGVKGSQVSLQVLNLTNERYNSTEYISSGGYFETSYGGYAIANPGAPLAVYATLSAKF